MITTFKLRRRITCPHCGLATDVIAHRQAGCEDKIYQSIAER